ncbi:hypothetical protein CC86DRAFT_472358 [Ophiobolus disseminans]|uniref:DUF7702 domain-containing protein n=1 Tax=Ophiobolus disseminans TaxID=1469910 RepID=A0A6A6ZFY6_9PLEO|nr:hypothetical protein CC86DRAFT_472358 [Ophiobolus disseminans]
MKPHTAVGIALVIFYIPITLYAQYIGLRCWRYRSRMACYMVMVFTLLRLAGGGLIITVEKDLSSDNAGMIKATYIVINLGIVPLLAAYDGFLNLVYRESFPNERLPRLIHIVCELLILLSTGLLVTAGTMTGKTDQATTQAALYKTGYFAFLAVFLTSVILSLRIALFERKRVKQAHLTITHLLLLAAPFLGVRTAYGVLGIFKATGANMFTSMWSSLFGNATVFAFMALVPEYIVICIFIHLLRTRVKHCKEMKRLLSEGGVEMGGRKGRGHGRR